MAYFGQLVLDGSSYLVGSSLYGVCNTAVNTSAKVVNEGLLGNTFDEIIPGISVNIQFTHGNVVDTITLQIGTTAAIPVHGNAKCNANAVLQFTFGQINNVNCWILNAGEKTATTVMHTYDSSSSEPISGRGVADAIAPLTGGNSAASLGVDTVIGDNPTDNKVPTSRAVANYIENAFNSANALVYKGDLSSAVPSDGYQAGWTYRIATAGTYAGQQCEIGDLIIAIEDAGQFQINPVNAHWIVVQTNLVNAVSGPTTATPNNVAVFGADNKHIVDSGYTIETSVPSNAVFTDTQYEETGSIQAITNITQGSDFTIASIVSGVLNISHGFNTTKSTASTGIREVT